MVLVLSSLVASALLTGAFLVLKAINRRIRARTAHQHVLVNAAVAFWGGGLRDVTGEQERYFLGALRLLLAKEYIRRGYWEIKLSVRSNGESGGRYCCKTLQTCGLAAGIQDVAAHLPLVEMRISNCEWVRIAVTTTASAKPDWRNLWTNKQPRFDALMWSYGVEYSLYGGPREPIAQNPAGRQLALPAPK